MDGRMVVSEPVHSRRAGSCPPSPGVQPLGARAAREIRSGCLGPTPGGSGCQGLVGRSHLTDPEVLVNSGRKQGCMDPEASTGQQGWCPGEMLLRRAEPG